MRRHDIQHNDTRHFDTQHNSLIATLSITTLLKGVTAIILNAIMLSVSFSYSHGERHYSECQYTERHFAECHYYECCYANRHYAECRCAESRGAS
jgi:hypothetical protein